jgi:DNA-binding MarR family transcriptional regulator
VDRLLAKGLVKKVVCKTDRRLVDILITEKGKKLLHRLDQLDNDMDAILKNISEKEAAQLSDLLDKLRNAAE